jgi:hypothetical protein
VPLHRVLALQALLLLLQRLPNPNPNPNPNPRLAQLRKALLTALTLSDNVPGLYETASAVLAVLWRQGELEQTLTLVLALSVLIP